MTDEKKTLESLRKAASLSPTLSGEEERRLKEKVAEKFGLPSPDLDGLKAWVAETLKEKGLPHDEEAVSEAILNSPALRAVAVILA